MNNLKEPVLWNVFREFWNDSRLLTGMSFPKDVPLLP